MSDLEWMNDVTLSMIPKEKLIFIQELFLESKNLSEKERLPFLLAIAKKARTRKISFSEYELQLIIDVLKKNSSEKEVEKMNQVLHLFFQKK